MAQQQSDGISAHTSVETQILNRMRRAGRGSVWCVDRLGGLASRSALDQALRRLCERTLIQRIAHGVYLFPLDHPFSITAPATVAATLQMLIDGGIPAIIPIGMHAAALYDLATPVPTYTYGAVGVSRRIVTPWWELSVTPVAERFVLGLHTQTATIIQAMRWIGQAHWDDTHQRTLRAVLTPQGRHIVAAQAVHAPRWMQRWLIALGADQG